MTHLRASLAFVLACIACLTSGTVLSRLDRAQLTADAARAEVRLVHAQLEQHAIVHRDLKPSNDPRCELALRRTTALRSALFALVRINQVSMVGTPDAAWMEWK